MKKLTPALYVRLYMESHAAGHTMRQFADRIGMPYQHAYARAQHYRKRGVRLPALSAARPGGKGDPLNVGDLNAIVAAGAPGGTASAGQEGIGRRPSGRRPVVLAR